ncbi:hypothetical protein B0H13DRAFT_2359445 [Mycena leptocephala]|nr:hypothetical protein B0H13DRAFT_2359445 [Mycena leptocephala]
MLFANSMAVLCSFVTFVTAIDGINLGTFTVNGDHVAWFSGHPQSNFTDIGPNNVNPCSPTFKLKTSTGGTTGTYHEFGCGTSDYGINKNGVFYPVAPVSPSQIPMVFIRSTTAPKLLRFT